MTTIDGVSVIIPTYDDITYLGQAIDSVLEQSNSSINIEIILVDSSSTETVERIANSYGSNVRYEWMVPEGVAAARNRGINLARYQVIGFCDADDYWHKDKLRHQIPKIEAGYDIVYSDEYLLTGGSQFRLSSPEVDHTHNHHIKYFRVGGVGSRSILVRRSCIKNELFDERFVVREDPHLWTRLFERCSVTRVQKPLSFKRRRANSITSDRDRGFQMEMMEISDLIKRYPELIPYYEERITRAKFRYAKTLLSDENRSKDARKILFELFIHRHFSIQSVLLFMISLIPFGSRYFLRAIQRIRWRVKSFR